MANLNNVQCVNWSLIALGHIEMYLEAYDADRGSEDLKDRGRHLCAELRTLLEAAK